MAINRFKLFQQIIFLNTSGVTHETDFAHWLTLTKYLKMGLSGLKQMYGHKLVKRLKQRIKHRREHEQNITT